MTEQTEEPMDLITKVILGFIIGFILLLTFLLFAIGGFKG